MSDPKEFLEKAYRFLKQQQEVYGDFSVKGLSASDVQTKEQVSDNIEESIKESTPDKPNSKNENQHTAAEEGKNSKNLSTSERIANCKTLEELRALCEKSEELKTDLDGTNLVFGVGNPDADIMVIGEAPGFNEDKQGEPFVGEAGQLLDKIMGAINFSRDDIYIANILKHRPPNNRDPKPEESARSLPYLMRQIELVDPKLILCVGRISATTLLNEDTSLGRLRNKFHDFHGRELLATYHPAALLRYKKYKRPTWEDVQMLRKRYDELKDS
ncbi:MAG TPA: uracil-DNA glycosylase [Gracilimonas sp.]|uniref:uracil-DNA glycosylase n=1 Tax=Gracilimonas sp. TaxID=1974203 RepID=UPI002D94BD1F|nr:uracil-DNA glycosylase [Gracilimonas sp.]